MALELGILVAASAHAGAENLDGAAEVTAHVSAALTASAALLTMALLIVALVIVPARRAPSAAPVEPATRSNHSADFWHRHTGMRA